MLAPVLLLLTVTAPQGAQTPSERGDFLYHQCLAVSAPHPTPDEIYDGNICTTYFVGFMDGRGIDRKYPCMLGKTYKDLIAHYLKYMDGHPDYLATSKYLGAEAAVMTFCWAHKPK